MKVFNHGNRLRSEKEAYEAKKERAKRIYEEKNMLIDPYWKNEKILRKYYNLYGKNNYVSPQLIENEGFDFHLYSRKVYINGFLYEMMNKHGYVLLKNENILICKI